MTPEKEPHPKRRKGKRRGDHQVEAGDGRQRAQQQYGRQEQLVQGIGKRRLARRGIGIPQRPGAGHDRTVDPEMPRPEDHREVADVIDFYQAHAARERDARDENGERRPEPSGGTQTAQMKLLGGYVRLASAGPERSASPCYTTAKRTAS